MLSSEASIKSTASEAAECAESAEAEVCDNIGLRDWPSCAHLSHWLAQPENKTDLTDLRNKTVLELGSGTGSFAKKLIDDFHAKRVIASDGEITVFENLCALALLNPKMVPLQYDWGTQKKPNLSDEKVCNFFPEAESKSGAKNEKSVWDSVDIVICCDVVYVDSNFIELSYALQDIGKPCLILLENRPYPPPQYHHEKKPFDDDFDTRTLIDGEVPTAVERFVAAAVRRGFLVENLPLPFLTEATCTENDVKNYQLYRILMPVA